MKLPCGHSAASAGFLRYSDYNCLPNRDLTLLQINFLFSYGARTQECGDLVNDSRAEDTGRGHRGPLRRRSGPTPRRARVRFDELITTDGRAGRRERARTRPFGEIDLRNAPEIAFFRRRGRIPPRAIRAPRKRASRRAPFWGLRCVRCGGR